jgi:hypothetical protein
MPDSPPAAATGQKVANGILALRTALQTSSDSLTRQQEDVLIELGKAKVDNEDLPVRKSPEGAKADYLRYGKEAAQDILNQYERDPSVITNNRDHAEAVAEIGARLGFGVIKPEVQAQAPAERNYTGDFNYTDVNVDSLKGKVFADGDYRLPAALKQASLKAADEILEAEGTQGVLRLLPGVDLKGNGKPTREEVAAYLLAESMQTEKPYNLLGNNPHTVEPMFNNKFDTRKPLDEAGIEVVRQIYGDNFDASMGTNTPAADQKFKRKMGALLPTPKC